MPATYLDNATVTEILRFRPVYITTRFVVDYDDPTSDILAVQFSFESAVLKALQTGFRQLSRTAYNPHLRWSTRKLTRWEMDEEVPEDPQYEWCDNWTGWTSMSSYHIEEWQPDRARSGSTHLDSTDGSRTKSLLKGRLAAQYKNGYLIGDKLWIPGPYLQS